MNALQPTVGVCDASARMGVRVRRSSRGADATVVEARDAGPSTSGDSDPTEPSVTPCDLGPATPFDAVDSVNAPVMPDDFDPLTAFDAVESADTAMIPGVDAPAIPGDDPPMVSHADAPMIPDVVGLTDMLL